MTPKQADNAGTGERASAATAERPYVVLKRGLFWRPNDRGYTYNIAEAGRYTREEAEARCHPDNEPVTMELASKYESMKTYTQAELDQHVAAATAKERQARELAEGEVEVLARDSGLYRGTLFDSAKQLGCDEHMVDHAVKALLADNARLREALGNCLRLAECCCSVPEVPGGDWNHIISWAKNALTP